MSQGLIRVYAQGVLMCGAAFAVGNALRHAVFGKEEASDWSFVLGSAVLWPVATPVLIALTVDGVLTGAHWSFSFTRVTKSKV